MGCHFLLQGIFPTQGSNFRLLAGGLPLGKPTLRMLNNINSLRLLSQSLNKIIYLRTGQFSSVQLLSPVRLCDPMNHSMPGLPVHHQVLEFTQTHIHRVSDAIQPSHPRSLPSPPAPNPSQHQSLFQWVNSSHEVAKVLEMSAPGNRKGSTRV